MNPKSFPMSRDYFLSRAKGKIDWWGITKYLNKIEKCDIVFIWHSNDKRNRAAPKHRGIYAQGKVLSVPPHPPDTQNKIDQLKHKESPLFLDPNERTKHEAKPSILLEYDKSYIKYPLTTDEIENAGLGYIHIITFPHQDICSLSESDAAQIMKLLETHPPDPLPLGREGGIIKGRAKPYLPPEGGKGVGK